MFVTIFIIAFLNIIAYLSVCISIEHFFLLFCSFKCPLKRKRVHLCVHRGSEWVMSFLLTGGKTHKMSKITIEINYPVNPNPKHNKIENLFLILLLFYLFFGNKIQSFLLFSFIFLVFYFIFFNLIAKSTPYSIIHNNWMP